MMVFDRSEKKIIAGPITINDDEPVIKYQAESDGRTFWAYNAHEVFYEDERLYGALDEIERLRAVIEWIGANADSPSTAIRRRCVSLAEKVLEDK